MNVENYRLVPHIYFAWGLTLKSDGTQSDKRKKNNFR